VLCGFLVTPLSGKSAQEYLVAGILLLVGVALWVINYFVVGKVDVDPERLSKA